MSSRVTICELQEFRTILARVHHEIVPHVDDRLLGLVARRRWYHLSMASRESKAVLYGGRCTTPLQVRSSFAMGLPDDRGDGKAVRLRVSTDTAGCTRHTGRGEGHQ